MPVGRVQYGTPQLSKSKVNLYSSIMNFRIKKKDEDTRRMTRDNIRKQKEEMQSVKKPFAGLTIFVMNVEAYSTRKGQVAGEWMANSFGSLGCIAVDESTTIKNHKAKRTKALLKISRRFI